MNLNYCKKKYKNDNGQGNIQDKSKWPNLFIIILEIKTISLFLFMKSLLINYFYKNRFKKNI